MNNKVTNRLFIGTIGIGNLAPAIQPEAAMFLFNRSGLAVILALVVAVLPVLIQYL